MRLAPTRFGVGKGDLRKLMSLESKLGVILERMTVLENVDLVLQGLDA